MLLAMTAASAQTELRAPMTIEHHKRLGHQTPDGAKPRFKKPPLPRHEAEPTEQLEYYAYQMSFYDGINFIYDGGTFSTYKTTVCFYDDGTVAIDNLFNLKAHNNDGDKEQTLYGTYDSHTGVITISTPADNMPLVAYLWNYYNGYLASGFATENYEFDAQEVFELKVSADKKTIETVHNALILEEYNDELNTHTCIKYVKLFQPCEGQRLVTFFDDDIRFRKTLFPGTTTSRDVFIANVGTDDMDFLVGIDDETPFGVNPENGTVQSMDTRKLSLDYSPVETGDHSARMTIITENDNKQVSLSGCCIDYPDFSRLVKEGEISFRTGIDYPFALNNSLPRAAQSTVKNEKGESWLDATIEVPEGKIGVLKWEGKTYSDFFWGSYATITADGSKELFHSGMGPETLDGQCMFLEGTHTVRFLYGVYYPPYITEKDYMSLTSFSFTTMDIDDDKCVVPQGNHLHFGSYTADRATNTLQVKLLNLGKNALKCVSAEDAPCFHVVVTDEAAATLDTLHVSVAFQADKAGTYGGTIRLNTTAGHFDICCDALVRDVPDYTRILAKDTDPTVTVNWDYSTENPFVIDETTLEAVNCTARELDSIPSHSWFSATFTIPEGKMGKVSWDGTLDIDGVHDDGVYYDYAQIFIAHPDRQYGITVIGNMGVDSESCFKRDDDPAWSARYFNAGENYIQWSVSHNGDSFYKGQDEMRIGNFRIELEDYPDHACRPSVEVIDFGEMLLGKRNSCTIQLTNLGGKMLQINRIVCDKPVTAMGIPTWGAAIMTSFDLTFEFNGEEAGEHEGTITIYTNAGEVVLLFTAQVVDPKGYVLAEDFEDEMKWFRTDADGDGKGWNSLYNIYSTMSYGHCHSGEDGLGSSGYYYYMGDVDPDDWTYSPMVDIPADGEYELAWWIGVDDTDVDNYAHNYSVYAGEEMDRRTLTQIYTEQIPSTGWHYRSASLKEWAGKTICVSFRHHDSKGLGIMKLDDVYIRPTSAAGITHTTVNAPADGVYSLSGVKTKGLTHGVNIIKRTDASGNMVIRKIIK